MNRALCRLATCLALAMACWQCQPAADTSPLAPSSGFDITETDSVTAANLETLARVWGFAKYHHPAFFSRKAPDADAALFRLLPQVAAASPQECNRILLDWLDELGEFTPAPERYTDFATGAPYRIECNTAWIDDTLRLGRPLSERLAALRHAKRRGTNRYVAPTRGVGNPSFREAYYPDAAPDAGYRLLTLFRYWNIIEYYSPNRHLTDRPWKEVLPLYIDRFVRCGAEGYEATLAQLIAELDDSHATFSAHYRNRRYAPVQAQFIEGRLIVIPSQPAPIGDGFASAQEAWPPLRFGDEIVCVNGTPIPDLMAYTAHAVSHSNEAALLARTAWNATSPADGADSLTLVFRRDGTLHTATLPTLPAEEAPNTDFPLYTLDELGMAMLTPTVVYLDALHYTSANSDAITKALHGTEALIVDLRRYPNDFMIYDFFGRHFVPEPTCNALFSQPTYILPGCWVVEPSLIGRGTNRDGYRGRVIALVDGNTISQAEYTAMTIQALPNGCTVGSTTMGADGNISVVPLPGGYQTILSGLGVYYPDGSETQRCGIRIDYPVTPTLEGILAGRDEVLERALQLIVE